MSKSSRLNSPHSGAQNKQVVMIVAERAGHADVLESLSGVFNSLSALGRQHPSITTQQLASERASVQTAKI